MTNINHCLKIRGVNLKYAAVSILLLCLTLVVDTPAGGQLSDADRVEKLYTDLLTDSYDNPQRNRFYIVLNDDFFNSSPDPFKDIEGLGKKLENESSDSSLREMYKNWVAQYLQPEVLEFTTDTFGNKVILDFGTAKVDKPGLAVDVNKKRIRLKYQLWVEHKFPKPDGIVQTRSFKKGYTKIMPIPDGADPKKFKIETTQSHVKIIFGKLQPSRRQEGRISGL